MKKLLVAFSLFGMLFLTACDMDNDTDNNEGDNNTTNQEHIIIEEQ